MSRNSLLAKALAAAVALAALLPTTAAYAAPGPSAAVAQARVPRAVSLVGTELRLANDEVVTLPRNLGRWPVLLGTANRGWVVASRGGFWLVLPDGQVEGIGARDQTNLYVTEGLSDDGRYVVSASSDQGDALTIRVVNVRGQVVTDARFGVSKGDLLDATGGDVYVGGSNGLFLLERGADKLTQVVRRPTGQVDLDHDTVFVSSRSHPWRFGPTSLTTPGTPPWRARFTPVAVSPDGRYVVGREGTVRAMSDGHVVRRVRVQRPRDEFRFAGWASSRRVLLQQVAGRRDLLVSCPVPRGACRRVGSTTGLVSLPTSHAGPYQRP